MDSFVALAKNVVLVATIVLVILLLVLMPAMALILLAVGAAAALWMLVATSLQVVRSAERELTLTWPGWLSNLARRDSPRRPAESGNRTYASYEPPEDDEAEAGEPDEHQIPVARPLRLLPSTQTYNEVAARWQPVTEPTYRQYLLGQAWIDLATTLTESGTRLFLLASRLKTESDQRLSGEKRSAVLFPVRWSVNVAVAATVLAAVVVSIAVSAICGLVLTVGVLAWLIAAVALRGTEAAVARAREITMPCQTCDRQIRLPSYECRKCGARHNKLMANRFGALRHPCHCGASLPTTILMGKWRLKAYCTNSECAIRLPPGIGRIPIQHVPILGARQAGKSTLSCLMLRDLDLKLAGHGGSLRFEDRRDKARLGLTENCKFVSKTTETAGLRPALITVSHWGGKRRLLYFFDPAGEDIDKRSALVQHAFMSYMTTFVVTLDPLTIPVVGARLGPARSSSDSPRVPSSPDVLDALIGTLQDLDDEAVRRGQRGSGPRIKRVAVVVTKADLLLTDQQEQLLHDSGQWLADMGLRDQLETLRQLAGQVQYLASGLPNPVSGWPEGCVDYATLALWISNLADEPPGGSPDDGQPFPRPQTRLPATAGASRQGGSSVPPEPEPESEADREDEAMPTGQRLAASYRRGRIGLLALAMAGAAFSWFVILDVLFRSAYHVVP